MLFILTVRLPLAAPTISVCNEALAETDECLRFAWEKYFVLLLGVGIGVRMGRKSEEVRFINDGIVHFPTRERSKRIDAAGGGGGGEKKIQVRSE